MDGRVLFKQEGQVGILQIKRPLALNALNIDIVKKIGIIIDEIKLKKDIKVLIIIGSENFAAGADIKGMVNCNSDNIKTLSFSDTFNKIESMEIPTIAAINGYALGGGLELALTCDLRIASENAKFALPEITLGIMPGAGGTVRLPKLIGEAKAKEMIFSGGMIDAEEALKIGLINKITISENLEKDAKLWAEKIASRPLYSLKGAKKSVKYGMETPNIEKALNYEFQIFSELFNTKDQKEGMKAFIEKRKPNFIDE